MCLPTNATDWHVVYKVPVSKVTVYVMTHFVQAVFLFFWGVGFFFLGGVIHLLTLVSLYQVITPEEIVDPNVDEHSVMTYLSQFPKAKLKPGAPLRPKLNPKKARAYGPGTLTFVILFSEYKAHRKELLGYSIDIHRRCIELSSSV